MIKNYVKMDLNSPLSKYLRILEPQQKALNKLRIGTIRQLLYYFPTRYGDTASVRSIQSLVSGENVALYGRLTGLKTKKAFHKKIPMAEATLSDETGSIDIVWFHQPYIAKMLHEGALVRVEGKVSARKDKLTISNPKIENVGKLPTGVGDSLFQSSGDDGTLYPVYSESRGVTSNWLYHAVQKLFKLGVLDSIVDPIPEEILKTYNLPNLHTALIWIHAPKKETDAQSARKRFAFEEIFFIQIERQKSRREWQEQDAYRIEKNENDLGGFLERFPYQLTNAQKKSINHILSDFKKPYPMSRLLEGDVGSGKTAVAAATAYAVITTQPKGQSFGNLQVAYMAPTEILAQQHFESFIEYFKNSGIQIGLITGSGCKKFPSKVNPSGSTNISRPQLLKWAVNGEIPILVGTHSLIQKTVRFKHLAYVIIDEQHRFGTLQRQKLREKENITPHLLSMTATPIPRTLALTLYGDLDLSLLDEMPVGRRPIQTTIVRPEKRAETYEAIKKELSLGRQAYVICPRIDEPDPDKEQAVLAKSVKEEAIRLKKEIFQDKNIDILHSKMTPIKKDEVMNKFKDGKIDILVATSVVEVGVNVPNATMIIIEGAERFGLAQLHQLRGRVIRSNHQAYCFVFAETKTQKSLDRLRALTKAANGFELAEYDLSQRGAGELYGRKQWGLSDIGMEAIRNIKMVEAARLEATRIIDSDPNLDKHSVIKKIIEENRENIHFE
jgi:ATP-dependent DNA helicase RecG